jgi:hypothetical protein
VANQGHDDPATFTGACQAWLSYYEQMGYAANGYGFSNAIPVNVTMIPGRCVPCRPVVRYETRYYTPKHHWQRHRPLPEKKRIPLK